jgi:hypothetical protein
MCNRRTPSFPRRTTGSLLAPHARPLPWSYDQVWRVYQKAPTAARTSRLGTPRFATPTTTCWIAWETPPAVQLKLMPHTDLGTTMNVNEDVTTNQDE